MLDRSSRIEDVGSVKWDLALTNLSAWVLCFLCIIKGIKSSGKVRTLFIQQGTDSIKVRTPLMSAEG